MRSIFWFIVALLVVPVWAQDPSASVEPDLQPMDVEPTFVDGGPEVHAKPPGTAEKAKEGVLRGYDALKKKMEEQKEAQKKTEEEAKPKWWERFLPGGGRPEPSSPSLPKLPKFGFWGQVFTLIVMFLLTPVVSYLATQAGQQLTKNWEFDDKLFHWLAIFICGYVESRVLEWILRSIPGFGYIFGTFGSYGQLLCAIIVGFILWKFGFTKFKKKESAKPAKEK